MTATRRQQFCREEGLGSDMGLDVNSSVYIGFEVTMEQFTEKLTAFRPHCAQCAVAYSESKKFCPECGNRLEAPVPIDVLKPDVMAALDGLAVCDVWSPELFRERVLTNVAGVQTCDDGPDKARYAIAARVADNNTCSQLSLDAVNQKLAEVTARARRFGVCTDNPQLFLVQDWSY